MTHLWRYSRNIARHLLQARLRMGPDRSVQAGRRPVSAPSREPRLAEGAGNSAEPAGLFAIHHRPERLQPGSPLLNPPGSTRGFQRIGAHSRVHTAANVLFRFYVHAPGKPLSVLHRKTEVDDAVPRLRSLRPMSATHV